MKKFKVTYKIATNEALKGMEEYTQTRYDVSDDYFTADTAEEIIPIALDWIKDMSLQNNPMIDVDIDEQKQEIIFTDVNGEKELYYDFRLES